MVLHNHDQAITIDSIAAHLDLFNSPTLRLGIGRTRIRNVASLEAAHVFGAVAQLVERFVRIEEVVVSITISSTRRPETAEYQGFRLFLYLKKGS